MGGYLQESGQVNLMQGIDAVIGQAYLARARADGEIFETSKGITN